MAQSERPSDLDARLMASALQLAERARGRTGDNPHVGSVVAHGDRVIGEGWTSAPGGHHAEINALLAAESSGYSPLGATLYTTVEPCSFIGRTPACAPTIVAKGIARVVIGIRDPHPRVNGRGIEQLRAGGVEVVEGVCAAAIASSLHTWLSAKRG
jgi:diaminohydroxyphosphoribosylaminopyrimidine deaminase/5-amino-6-(5-phosphoribosylamino)uracil reductase